MATTHYFIVCDPPNVAPVNDQVFHFTPDADSEEFADLELDCTDPLYIKRWSDIDNDFVHIGLGFLQAGVPTYVVYNESRQEYILGANALNIGGHYWTLLSTNVSLAGGDAHLLFNNLGGRADVNFVTPLRPKQIVEIHNGDAAQFVRLLSLNNTQGIDFYFSGELITDDIDIGPGETLRLTALDETTYAIVDGLYVLHTIPAPPGPQGPQGEPGINWRPAGWSGGVHYAINDALFHNGSSYIALQSHTASSPTEPGVGGGWITHWQYMAIGGVAGVQGAPGSSGAQGAQGAQGDSGSSTSVFFYRADANNTAANDPGAGKIRWNHATQDQATELYIDWLTDDDFDPHIIYKLAAPPTRIMIADADLAVFYQVWEMTDFATEYPDWFSVPVNFVEGSLAHEFSHNTRIAVSLIYEGTAGPQGAQGAAGATGPQGPQGFQGLSGVSSGVPWEIQYGDTTLAWGDRKVAQLLGANVTWTLPTFADPGWEEFPEGIPNEIWVLNAGAPDAYTITLDVPANHDLMVNGAGPTPVLVTTGGSLTIQPGTMAIIMPYDEDVYSPFARFMVTLIPVDMLRYSSTTLAGAQFFLDEDDQVSDSATKVPSQQSVKAYVDAGDKKYIGQNLQTGTSYTLVLSDAGKMISLSNAAAIALTIPANASVAFPVDTRIDLMQYGAGQVTVGITTDTLRGSTKTPGQYKGVSLWKRTATEWVIFGGTT